MVETATRPSGWLLWCSLAEIPLPVELDWLSLSEQQRLSKLSSPRRRETFLRGHYGLRLALADCLGGSINDWLIEQLDSGALQLASTGHQNIGVSISHSGDWLALAISAVGPVGVDIEQIKPRPSLAELLADYAAPALQHACAELPGAEQLRLWYRWWCSYESWVKQQGRGIDLAEFGRMTLEVVDEGDLPDDCKTLCLEQAELMLAVSGEAIRAGSPELPVYRVIS